MLTRLQSEYILHKKKKQFKNNQKKNKILVKALIVIEKILYNHLNTMNY